MLLTGQARPTTEVMNVPHEQLSTNMQRNAGCDAVKKMTYLRSNTESAPGYVTPSSYASGTTLNTPSSTGGEAGSPIAIGNLKCRYTPSTYRNR